MPRFPHNDIVSLVGATPHYDLAESVGPDLQLGELLDAEGLQRLGALALGYATAAGDGELRAQVAQAHGVAPDEVLITAGGMQALFLLAFTLCEPGTEAVIAAPVFPLAGNVLRASGATVRTLPLQFDDGYRVQPQALAPLLTPATRLVSLASPQNPSGVAVPLQTLREILALMRERAPQACLLVDETYREAAYGDTPVAPSAIELGERVVCTGSLSKCHGAPGLRVGWAVTRDAALREQLTTAKFNTVISCGRVDEALALQVLRQGERIVGQRRRRLQANLEQVAQWVQRENAHVQWVAPSAGALCCVRLRPEVFDDAQVQCFHALLTREGVRVADGRWFRESARVFRLGFGWLPEAALAEALHRLSVVLHEVAPAQALQ